MSTTGTLLEPQARAVKNVALLTYVLGYDDLCTADFPDPLRLDAGEFPITLARAAAEAALGFRTPSEIVVPDPWMSGRHAVLHRRGAVDVICDSGSRNGTHVNGEAVGAEGRTLVDGDLVGVGHALFCYRVLPAPAAEGLLGRAAPVLLGPTRTRSPEVAALVRALERVAGSDEAVLLFGETGTGKEVCARAVHDLSGRKGELRAVHGGAVPEALFESMLFGHVRGAFTGAELRQGEIARAHRGTLFLDEIATMGPSCQAKLLRVLEDGVVTKVGGSKAERFDVRWVSATNADLFAETADFRTDLRARLASCVVRLPPLRARREDLGALTAHVLREGGIARASITTAAARRFFSGTFPGNIRDLRPLRSAARLAGEAPIEVEHLPPAPTPASQAAERNGGAEAEAKAKEVTREDVENALRATGGNVVHTAKRLGTHARQVYRYLERFSLDAKTFRR